MNIRSVFLNYFNNHITKKFDTDKALSSYTAAYRKNLSKSDTVEISSDGYEMQAKSDNINASSGKDELGITKGETPNSYVIHFDNVALANRTVSRGYINVNGNNIQLSDDMKEKILKTSEEAFKANEKAIIQYVMQYNAIVARQQSDVLSNELKRMSRAMSVMSKMSSGRKVSEADKQFLAKYDPEMYAMAISAAMMAKRQEKQEEKILAENCEESNEQTLSEDYAKELEDLKCEYTETTLSVSFEDGIVLGDVSTSTSEFL